MRLTFRWIACLACVAVAGAAFTIAYLNSEDESDAAVECRELMERRMRACLLQAGVDEVRREADSPRFDPALFVVVGSVAAVAGLLFFALAFRQSH
jgi:hypothetical protein